MRRYQPMMTPNTTPQISASPNPIAKFFPLNARSARRLPWVNEVQNALAIAEGPLKNSGEIQLVYDHTASQIPKPINTAPPPKIVASYRRKKLSCGRTAAFPWTRGRASVVSVFIRLPPFQDARILPQSVSTPRPRAPESAALA